MADVFVVGALHLDVVVTAPRLPRIDETLVGHSVSYPLGGKGGNQALAAARFGARVAMAGRVGQDEFGDRMLRGLAAGGVDCGQIRQVPQASGISVAIVEDNGDYGAVIVSGANLGVDPDQIALPDDLRVLLLQNELPEQVNLQIARQADRSTRVILNAAPARATAPALLERVDLLVVNRLEAAMLTGQSDDLPDPMSAARALHRTGPGTVIVTLGADGCVGCDADGGEFSHPAAKVKVVSTHGAGDAFVGALSARLAHGSTLDEAIAFAQAAAALHVSSAVTDRPKLNLGRVREFMRGWSG